MGLFWSLIVFLALLLIAYWFVNKNELNESLGGLNKEQSEDISESKKIKKIMEKVDNFLKDSQFIEPIAKWREENIFRYVLNGGFLYEFSEIMPPEDQKIGLDDDFLCFKQLAYKRVNNPQDFFDKLMLSDKKDNIVSS
jgi:cbb3-type cytochrome oxidase subunit 3